MPGFYINHLKSSRARELAAEIETQLALPLSGKGMNVLVQCKGLGKEDLDEILSAGYAVLRDHPEIFWFKSDLESFFDGRRVTLKLQLIYPQKKVRELKERTERKISEILKLVPYDTSLWEKERILFEYLQLNTIYTDDGAPERYNIVGSLLEGSAVCEGISKAFAVLCHRAGIPCIVVSSNTHMWNIVSIDGKPVNVDVTHATGTPHTVCDYSYFNVSDSDINDEEHRKEIACIPACPDGSKSYYAKMNLCFENERELMKYVGKNMLKGKPVYAKLLKGDIALAVRAMSYIAPPKLVFAYNEGTKTALITSK